MADKSLMTVPARRTATGLLACVLTLSATCGIALANTTHTMQPTRAGLVRQPLVSPADSSLARQDLFREPLKWSPDSSVAQWRATSTADPEAPNGIIQSVSCVSATHCEAVGSYQTDADQPFLLAEAWNGTSWTRQAVPKPTGSASSELQAVSCTGTNDCVAVGDYGLPNGNLRSFAEVWDGASWSLYLTPNPAGNLGATLNAVSCLGSVCEAVGYYFNGDYEQLALAEVWNGTTWKIQTTPNPTTTNGDQLNGVSCTALSCEAVGSYGTGAEGLDSAAFAEVWDGVTWSLQTIPEPSDSNDLGTALESVSCVSSGDCEAVGSYANKTDFQVALAELWNGITWAVQPAANPTASTGLSLQVVSCVSKDVCAAVGFDEYDRGADTGAVTEVWDGVDWTLQSTPNPDGSRFTALATVSCPVTGFCESAGAYTNSSGGQAVLAEGTTPSGWVAQATPDGDGNYGAQLAGVSCVKRSVCEAVGDYYANNNISDNAWAEQWSDGRLKLQAVPDPRGTSNSELNAISCRSAGRCEAVGDYSNSVGDELTIGELWNGRHWTEQRTPNPRGSLGSTLEGVSCSSSSDCEAVGHGGTINFLVLAEHWNGHTWDLQQTARTGGVAGELRAVSCVSAQSCEAVGDYYQTSKRSLLLAERWNGHKWLLQRIPAPDGSHNALLGGVSCTSSDACEAVGTYQHGQGSRPLAEVWNGHKWSLQHTVVPGSSGDDSLLSSVSCTSRNSCEATGYHLSSASFAQFTLVERWNGHSWRRQTSASPGDFGIASSTGVSCVSQNFCRLVGYYTNSTAAQDQLSATLPLVETFTG